MEAAAPEPADAPAFPAFWTTATPAPPGSPSRDRRRRRARRAWLRRRHRPLQHRRGRGLDRQCYAMRSRDARTRPASTDAQFAARARQPQPPCLRLTPFWTSGAGWAGLRPDDLDDGLRAPRDRGHLDRRAGLRAPGGPPLARALLGGSQSRAWAMWLTSSLLIGALALHRHDPVFIALQASSLTAAAVIVLLTHRYPGMTCEAHAHLRVKGGAETAPRIRRRHPGCYPILSPHSSRRLRRSRRARNEAVWGT